MLASGWGLSKYALKEKSMIQSIPPMTESSPTPVHPGLTDRGRVEHIVDCPYCHQPFDLFGAPWCGHQDEELSKICPHCDRCLCDHPAYHEPHFWKPAPAGFQMRGFQRLFLLYL